MASKYNKDKLLEKLQNIGVSASQEMTVTQLRAMYKEQIKINSLKEKNYELPINATSDRNRRDLLTTVQLPIINIKPTIPVSDQINAMNESMSACLTPVPGPSSLGARAFTPIYRDYTENNENDEDSEEGEMNSEDIELRELQRRLKIIRIRKEI